MRTRRSAGSEEDFLARWKLTFDDTALFRMALTHRSLANETGRELPDNQRLEYLGDSVIGLVVNDYLYRNFPESPEGELARLKSAVVSEAALANFARRIGLGDLLKMGKGAEAGGGRDRASILADAFEALAGALYLDNGLPAVRKFLLRLIPDEIHAVHESGSSRDPKSTLQEIIQKKTHEAPVYEIVSASGPDHKKEFVCRVLSLGKELGRGTGASRKQAEQSAARSALSKLGPGRRTPRERK